jgi:hypothetical protein
MSGDLQHPTRPFVSRVKNKALIRFDTWEALARRLGGPWVAQGPSDPNPKSAEGCKISSLALNTDLLIAES